MNKEEFERQYLGVYVPDRRSAELEDRLKKYYQETEHCSNSRAMEKWRQFRQWAEMEGYTREEINEAKKSERVNEL